MPDDTDQPTGRTGRGTLLIVLLAAVIGAGLWYVLERPGTGEPVGDAAPAAGDSRTADSGTPRTTDSGVAPQAGGGQTADAGATPQAGGGQSADAGATPQAGGGQSADAGATPQAGGGQSADAGATPQAGGGQSADAGATPQAGGGQSADAGATPQAGGGQSADAGATPQAGGGQTADAGATPQAGGGQTADAGATPQAGGGQTADAGATPQAGGGQTADAGATPRAGDAQTAGTTPRAGDAQTAGAGTTDPTGTTRTAESDASATLASVRTVETDAADPTGAAPSTDSSTASDAPRVAAADPGAAPIEEAPVVAAAPEDTIEKTLVDAPPAAETTGETDLLAAVDRLIERVETAIQERLDSDTDLRVQVTYDDSQEDEPKADAAPDEATRTADSDATLPAADAPAPDSDGAAPADVAGSPDSDGTVPTDVAGSPDSDATAPADVAGSPKSDGAAPTDVAGSPKSDGTAVQDAVDTAASKTAKAKAKKYVETLTDTAPRTISVDRAEHFVTEERVISLVPEDTIENVSVEELARDETLSPDTPITVVREVEQIETAVPEQLIADSGGDLDKTLRVQVTYDDSQDEAGQEDSGPKVIDQDTVAQITVREALERIRTEPEKPLMVIRTVRYFEVMTLKELLDSAQGDDAFLNVVTQPYRIASATLADLLQREKEENPGAVFYLHTVQDTDDQGIWGIVHFGLTDNFARGVAIRLGEDVETYAVEIPRDADERLDDRSSSFLGKLIDGKTKDSFVYNYRDNRMGRNPDRIYPGQEIVIIKFESEELMSIYTHFATS